MLKSFALLLVSGLLWFGVSATQPALAAQLVPCAVRLPALRAVARPASPVTKAFQLAERLERAGQIPEAKIARLALAKAVADSAKMKWPAGLIDADAINLIWAAHSLPAAKREAGFTGLRTFFSRYLKSERPALAAFKKAFGPSLAKELLRRGVAGEEQAFLNAIAAAGTQPLPRLVFADWLDEHERPASAETIRIAAELERLPVTREHLAERALLKKRLYEIETTALREWRESATGQLLESVGTYKTLDGDGLPVLRPHSHEALLASTPEQQQALTGLDLAEQGWTSELLQRLARLELNQVRTLDLSDNSLVEEGVRHLAAASSSFKNVSSLNLGSSFQAVFMAELTGRRVRNRIGAAGVGVLTAPTSIFKEVRSLNLDSNEIGDAGAAHLAAPNSGLKNLTGLTLVGNGITHEGAGFLAAPTSVLGKVSALDLSHNGVGQDGAGNLAASTSIFQNITSLLLTGCGIGPGGVERLAAATSVFKNVTNLALMDNAIGSVGARHLAAPTSVFKNVTDLDLEANNLGDEGARHIAAGTSVLKNVTSLNLSYNEIGNGGARFLAAPTSVFQNIGQLELQNNQIGEEGARSLISLSSALKQATSIGLSDNALSKELTELVAQEMARRRPRAK